MLVNFAPLILINFALHIALCEESSLNSQQANRNVFRKLIDESSNINDDHQIGTHQRKTLGLFWNCDEFPDTTKECKCWMKNPGTWSESWICERATFKSSKYPLFCFFALDT